MKPYTRKSLSILKYGRKAWSFEDFEECCRIEGVEIVYAAMKRPGFYWNCEGTPTIVLSTFISGIKKLCVAMHELGHYFSHTPEAALYLPNSKSKREYEAEKFALIGMIPLWLMRKMIDQNNLWDLQEEWGIGSEILNRRWQVYQRSKK